MSRLRRALRRWADRRAATRLIWRLHEGIKGPKSVPELTVEAWLWDVIGQPHLASMLREEAEVVARTELQDGALPRCFAQEVLPEQWGKPLRVVHGHGTRSVVVDSPVGAFSVVDRNTIEIHVVPRGLDQVRVIA